MTMREQKSRMGAGVISRKDSRASVSKLALAIAPLLAADASDAGLAEIIVTARKRSENLQDVPISIDVYTAKDLQNLGISQFEDYATMTPSVSFVSAGPGTQTFVMRGV